MDPPTDIFNPPTKLDSSQIAEEAGFTIKDGLQTPIDPLLDLSKDLSKETLKEDTLSDLKPEFKKDLDLDTSISFKPFDTFHIQNDLNPTAPLSKDNLNIEQKPDAGAEYWGKVNPPGRRKIPARKLPKWLPQAGGTPWKVWGYPDFQEYSSTEESDEEEMFPPGTEFKGHGVVNPDYDFTDFAPKWIQQAIRYFACFLFSINSMVIVKLVYQYWKEWMAGKANEEKDPERMESSSESD